MIIKVSIPSTQRRTQNTRVLPENQAQALKTNKGE